MVSAMRRPPSTLIAPQPVSFKIAGRRREGLLLRSLVGAERHVDDDQRAREPRITAWPCRIIMSSVTGTVVSSPCITMPSESPTRITSQ